MGFVYVPVTRVCNTVCPANVSSHGPIYAVKLFSDDEIAMVKFRHTDSVSIMYHSFRYKASYEVYDTYEKITKSHYSDCPEHPISCPNLRYAAPL